MNKLSSHSNTPTSTPIGDRNRSPRRGRDRHRNRDRNREQASSSGHVGSPEAKTQTQTGVNLTTLNPDSVRYHLSPHFNELKLADIVSEYLVFPFVMTWRTGGNYIHPDWCPAYAVMPLPTSISLPLPADGEYDFVVDWGNGKSDHITAFDQAEVTHEYGRTGEWTIQLTGTVNGFTFDAVCQRNVEGYVHREDRYMCPTSHQILDISQWGCVRLGDGGCQFYCCVDLKVSAVDVPDLTGVTNTFCMFRGSPLVDPSCVREWDMSKAVGSNIMFDEQTLYCNEVKEKGYYDPSPRSRSRY